MTLFKVVLSSAIIIAAGAVGSSVVDAQGKGKGATQFTPGHQMKAQDPLLPPAPKGASTFSPGHQMQSQDPTLPPAPKGASTFSPGHKKK